MPDDAKEKKEDILFLYSKYLDSIEQVNGRREKTNRFYIPLHAGILAIISAVITFTMGKEAVVASVDGSRMFKITCITLSAFSFFICLHWFLTLFSYNKITKAKYRILNKIESNLPIRCFQEEWKLLSGSNSEYRYIRLIWLEYMLPAGIAVIYILFIFLIIIPM